MPTREEVAYFGAGPAPLPTTVLEKGARAFVNFDDSGLGLAEISHRSPTANKILADTKAALISLLDIPDNYEILFMHGGGSGEFSAVVFNLVATWVEKRRRIAEQEIGKDDGKILQRVRLEVREKLNLDYIITGSWSLKASQEAANLLEPLKEGRNGRNFVNIVTDSRENNGGKFGNITAEESWRLKSASGNESAFVYFCDNETVDGVEFPSFPKILESNDDGQERLIVADMSSNLLSRIVDFTKFGVIYGGAQKNIGITDVTLVIVRKDILDTVPPPHFLHDVGIWSPPAVFNWSVIAKNNSLYNTMPIFSIWIAGEVMRGLLGVHGDSKVSGQEAIANAKAAALYRVIDAWPNVYTVVPDKAVRSRMNLCFRIRDAGKEKDFLAGAEKLMLQGLKGHRSVGGIRISNYNAVPIENVQKLAKYLQSFAGANTQWTANPGPGPIFPSDV
ncbi:Phosphoserine transaminase [Puttea exsequens]|nr:Phosphoserine transaminase [Puttea exsequens]